VEAGFPKNQNRFPQTNARALKTQRDHCIGDIAAARRHVHLRDDNGRAGGQADIGRAGCNVR
jgi:hypothetical protein